jgi:hypothetical protein
MISFRRGSSNLWRAYNVGLRANGPNEADDPGPRCRHAPVCEPRHRLWPGRLVNAGAQDDRQSTCRNESGESEGGMSLTRIMWRRLQLWLARRLLVMATRMANNVETHPG